jgi:putative transposase
MILSHKIQLITNDEHRTFFKKACGVRRFCYNWGLNEWIKQYEQGLNPNGTKLRNQLTAIKNQFPWMYESPKDALQHAFVDLQNAFKNFFEKRTNYPDFKKKNKSRDSFYISSDKFWIKGNIIKLPLIGNIELTESLRYEGKIQSATISRTADKWFVSISVDVENPYKERISDNEIALDFGLKSVYTDQYGYSITPLDQSRKEKRLKRYQLKYSRNKNYGSHRRIKLLTKIQRIHKKIKDKKQDFNHKLTHKICNENKVIYIEDLNINSWKKLWGKKSQNNTIGEIRRQLFYKAKIFNNAIVIIDKWFPSSKMDHKTGEYLKDLTLSDRWIFHPDGTKTDRDHNAAINILHEGRRILEEHIGLASPI